MYTLTDQDIVCIMGQLNIKQKVYYRIDVCRCLMQKTA
jgi:hypothetical protein